MICEVKVEEILIPVTPYCQYMESDVAKENCLGSSQSCTLTTTYSIRTHEFL